MTTESAEFTSGEIASAAKEAETAAASPAPQPTDPGQAAASPRETPGVGEDRYKNWIPPEAHERVVDGFHRRLDGLSWAAGLSQDEVQEALALRRSVAARTAQGQEPQPDAVDEARQPYYTPAQAAKWAAWRADAIVAEKMRAIEERIAPIESTFAETRQTETLARQVDTAQQWPGFIDHVGDITAAINENNAARERNPRIPALSLYEAYISIVPAKLAASRDQIVAEEKKKWLADLNKTTAVTQAGEVNPSRSPAASRKKDADMTISELIADEVAKRKAS